MPNIGQTTMRNLKGCCLLFFLLSVILAFGQHERDNWYFGNNAAIKFGSTNPKPTVANDCAMKTRASATISDEVTGQLLFYTDGVSVWNKFHALMPNGSGLINEIIAQGTLIVPFPGQKGKYFIFTVNNTKTLSYSIVDVTENGGQGNVISKNNIVAQNISYSFTAVKQSVNNGYWLVTHSNGDVANNSFFCFPITETGIKPIPTETKIGILGRNFGDLVSNAKGDKIVITHYADSLNAFAQVFDFDKFCGQLSNPITLHKDAKWNYAYGIAFSPDDSKLYVAYSYMESQVVQYSGTNFSSWGIAATDAQNLNNLMLGPDGKLYITTHDNSIPSPVIDVIEFPNNPAATCGYKKDALNLGIGRNSNFEFPNFINDTSKHFIDAPNYGISFSFTNTCLGDSVKFTIHSNFTADSVRWNFSDFACPPEENTSSLLSPKHKYSSINSYVATLDWYRCGIELFMAKRVIIVIADEVSLGNDTMVCKGDSIVLTPTGKGPKQLWSTGETTPEITVKKGGTYWVKVDNGLCSGEDSIAVIEHPNLMVDIGNEYAICDDSSELLKLDAGKGHNYYKWTPTGDTTQWIIVSKAGDYFVMVEDNNGCKAGDGATVKRLCDFTFYMPNAFSPNGDGKNDVFAPVFSDITDYKIEIFDRWGAKVFESTNPAYGWDGTYKQQVATSGTYIWQLSFKGLQNKQLRNYNHRGNVMLLR